MPGKYRVLSSVASREGFYGRANDRDVADHHDFARYSDLERTRASRPMDRDCTFAGRDFAVQRTERKLGGRRLDFTVAVACTGCGGSVGRHGVAAKSFD
jgi:hypothetical protein